MIDTDEIFIWVPRDYHPQGKVEIVDTNNVTTDVTADVISSEFRKLSFRIGIGDMKCKLNNTGGQYSNTWVGGETINFYADNGTGVSPTTKRFKGTIDYPKDTLAEDGQYLEIEGRHASVPGLEVFVTLVMTDTPDAIFRSLIDTFLPGLGYTYTNAQTFSFTVSVKWSNKPFAECLKDLCILADADGYFDDNLDGHLFPSNSIINNNEAVVEGAMAVTIRNFGKDTYLRKTKVRVAGNDDQNLPVLSTVRDSTSTGTPRELFIKDANISSNAAADDLADSTLDSRILSSLPPQGTTRTYMLFSLAPGENIWISALRQQIHGIYKVIETKHMFGRNGMWTDCQFEKEYLSINQAMRERIKKETELTVVEDPNRMEQSYNFTFDDDTNITFSNTQISNGALTLASGSTSGTATMSEKSAVNTSNGQLNAIELRTSGSDLSSSVFEFSTDSQETYQTMQPSTLTIPSVVGTSFIPRITLVSDSSNPNPRLESVAWLFK